MLDLSRSTRTLIQRFYNELWNEWQFDLIRVLLDPNLNFRGSLGTEVSGHAEFRNYMQTVRSAFPDFHNEVTDLIVADDRAAARLTYTGTHLGPLFGVPSTGRRIEYSGVALFKLNGKQIASGWVLGDTIALWRQIGVIPPGFPRQV